VRHILGSAVLGVDDGAEKAVAVEQQPSPAARVEKRRRRRRGHLAGRDEDHARGDAALDQRRGQFGRFCRLPQTAGLGLVRVLDYIERASESIASRVGTRVPHGDSVFTRSMKRESNRSRDGRSSKTTRPRSRATIRVATAAASSR
jgi:hypothetical protein